MNQTVCRVHIIDLPFHADKPFDYFIPDGVPVRPGNFVAVPFGGGNRTSLALVTALVEDDGTRKLKPVHSIVYGEYSLDEGTLGLVRFLSDRTLCSYGDAVKAILPVNSFAHLTDAFYPVQGAEEHDSDIFAYIVKKPGVTRPALEKRFGTKTGAALKRLQEDGAIECRAVVGSQNAKYTETVSLIKDAKELLSGAECKRSKKRAQVVRFLSQEGAVNYVRLKEEFSLTRAQLDAMCELGMVKVTRTDAWRNPYEKGKEDAEGVSLSEEQREARDCLCALFDGGKPAAALLYGVTGSGKTQVIRAVMDHVISAGKAVILLVPEISLTPQTVGLFSSWYGERVAVIHSGLSAGERFDAWRRIRAGEVDVCIGTRSAVFAPFENLGLIVLDEEQEHTYKSDQNPKYHARDVARYRCAGSGALMLLASATPSVESYHKACTGKYRLVKLSSRYGEAVLPETVMADQRLDAQAGNTSVLGGVLNAELKKNLDAGEQSILFVNRRGYNNFLSCNVCGTVKTCPHCSVSLTYHTRGRYRADEGQSIGEARAKNGYLTCHYCGYREAVPKSCESCGNTVLQFMGFGTQMAENYLQDTYPDAVVLRMDADTTQNKFAYDDILERFREGDGDVLLGTQMVTKGHDFPDVTLVGVLSADASLYLDDYRANERTFSLVTQVVGRAGRSAKRGRAVIQTYSPDHAVLRLAASQDYDGFYRQEIAMRRALVFPPFCDMALISFSASAEEDVIRVSTSFSKALQAAVGEEQWRDVQLQCFGPFEAPIYKKQDKYRMRIVIKCVSNAKTRSLFAFLLRSFAKEYGKVNIQIDINPSGL